MNTLAVLPIKNLDQAKQRLARELDSVPRRALVEAMFSDTLVALHRATTIDTVLVISSDHRAQRIAGGYGAMVIEDDDLGHNDAALQGIARAIELGAEQALLVPGDCPIIDPVEIDALVRHDAPSPVVLVVPDRHGSGTNALLLRPPGVLPPSFGEGSHARHLANASAAGVAAQTVEVGSLAIDVDTAEDLAAVAAQLDATRGGAAHTRGMLRQLLRSRG